MATREEELKDKMISALDGDASAYALLLNALVKELRIFFGRRVGDKDAVEDLVQETLIAVHTRRATFDRTRPFTAWLFAIARYKMVDHFRRSRFHALDGELEDSLAADDFEPASAAAIDVERLLDLLPPKQRQAIQATRLEGQSLAEAALSVGISQSDAKMSVYRGLRRLSARVQGKIR